jgi:hypothetical protein
MSRSPAGSSEATPSSSSADVASWSSSKIQFHPRSLLQAGRRPSTLPHSWVVCEVHADRIQRAEALDGAGIAGIASGRGAGRGGLGRTLPLGLRLHGLTGQHDRPVRSVQHERLMARGVPGRGDQPQPRCHLELTVQDLVEEARDIDPLGDGVVGFVHHRPLGSLDEDRHVRRDPAVLAAVVSVQVAVRRARDVRELDPVLGERDLDRRHARGEHRLDLGVADAHPVVEQEDPVPMHDGVPVGGPPLALQQLLLVRRQSQLGGEEGDHASLGHARNLDAGLANRSSLAPVRAHRFQALDPSVEAGMLCEEVPQATRPALHHVDLG